VLSALGLVAAKINERGAGVLAISGDSPFCHDAFARASHLPFPLLSDVHRTAIRAYGVLDEDRNVAYRSTFIVDRDGVLRWGQAGDREMVRVGAEIVRVVELIAARRGGR
jgi:peroxiredoxin